MKLKALRVLKVLKVGGRRLVGWKVGGGEYTVGNIR